MEHTGTREVLHSSTIREPKMPFYHTDWASKIIGIKAFFCPTFKTFKVGQIRVIFTDTYYVVSTCFPFA